MGGWRQCDSLSRRERVGVRGQSRPNIFNNNLRRTASVPCINAKMADDVERLAAVGQEAPETEADGAERAEGGGDVPAALPDELGILQKNAA